MKWFALLIGLLWTLTGIGFAHAVQISEQVQQPAYEVVVSFSDFSLHVFDPEGTELFVAPVALPRRTPKLPVEGRLTEIQRNPWWFPPPGVKAHVLKTEGKELPDKMPPGPGNPMGPVKFCFLFSTPGAEPLSRIHGTTHPESIGKRASSGCIRMLNEDAVALRDLIEPLFKAGIPVKVFYVKYLEEDDDDHEQVASAQ